MEVLVTVACPIGGHTDGVEKVSGKANPECRSLLVQGECSSYLGEQSSELTKMLDLAKPEKTKLDIAWGLVVGFVQLILCSCSLTLVAYMVSGAISNDDTYRPFWTPGHFSAFLFWFGIGVFLLVRPIRRRTKYRTALEVYEEQYKAWDLLYYCSQHDMVFNRVTGESRPPSTMKELLPLT
jgi:hypothetical protein